MKPRTITGKPAAGLSKFILRLILFPLLFLQIHSCSSSRITFSTDMVGQYSLQEEDLRGLLFYTDNTIRLRNEVDPDFRMLISTDRIIKRRGRTYEVITIRKGTPGILELMHGDSLMISFSRHNNILFLPCTIKHNYTSARKEEPGILLIGSRRYTCSRDIKLAIDRNTYQKFNSPRFFAQEW